MDKTNDIVVGAGRLYFKPADADGEMYFGDTPGFTIGITSDKLDVYSSDGPVAEKIRSVARNVERTASITCQNVSPDNLAMWLMGDVSSVTQTANEVADEQATVKKGEWYQLGGGVGVRAVSSVKVEGALKKKATYIALEADKHYQLDAENGRVLMLADAISFGDPLKFTYTPAAGTYPQISSSDDKSFEGGLRYIADNTTGTNRDLYAPNVVITPEGQIEWKSRDNPIQMTFSVEFTKKGSDEALYITNQETG